MGRFIVSRSAVGVRFLLQSDKGRTLAVSRDYATLDACKKGICSLVTYLPLSPVVDTAAGERGPNPKCEIAGKGEGYIYFVKSPNGKTLLTCQPMQTKKAVLRALAMLKEGVLGAEVLLWQRAGYTPLTLHLPKDCHTPDFMPASAPPRTISDIGRSLAPAQGIACGAGPAARPEEELLPDSVPEATRPGDPVSFAVSALPPAEPTYAVPVAAPALQEPLQAPAAKRNIFGKINKVR